MTKATNYIPAGTHTVTPHLILRGVAKAIEFYKKAFGAEELYRLPMPDGRIMHACITIGDSRVFLADEMPERSECGMLSPESLKATHASMHVYVPNVDEAFKRAIDAGAKSKMPVQDMFWGDRYGQVVDPFGQPWSLATHKEDLTPEQIQKNAAECMKQMAATK
jgi:PhnB protein